MIHSTAVVHHEARVGRDVDIGPYAVIGADAVLGDRVRVGSHAVLDGPIRIGAGTEIGPHAVLGLPPQDTGYCGEPTCLDIGENNVIREFVTINRGSAKQDRLTRIGCHNHIMSSCHIGHDCYIGNHIVMATGAVLGGHVQVEDYANIGGLSAVHQFVRIGAYAMLGGGTIATMDVPPFTLAAGNHARLFGINRRGLQRNCFEPTVVKQISRAYRILFRSGLRLQDAALHIEQDVALNAPEVQQLLAFMRNSRRGVIR